MSWLNLMWHRGVYVVAIGDVVKVGQSVDVSRRLHEQRAWFPPGRVTLVGMIPVTNETDPRQVETVVHTALKRWEGLHIGREWFVYDHKTIEILQDNGMHFYNMVLPEREVVFEDESFNEGLV